MIQEEYVRSRYNKEQEERKDKRRGDFYKGREMRGEQRQQEGVSMREKDRKRKELAKEGNYGSWILIRSKYSSHHCSQHVTISCQSQ
jgi:hypothetical protein